jgi:hypothetical protein
MISYIHTKGLSKNLRSYKLRTSIQETSMYVGIDIQKTYRAGIGIAYIHT